MGHRLLPSGFCILTTHVAFQNGQTICINNGLRVFKENRNGIYFVHSTVRDAKRRRSAGEPSRQHSGKLVFVAQKKIQGIHGIIPDKRRKRQRPPFLGTSVRRGYRGHFDHGHMHMKALKHLIGMNGAQNTLSDLAYNAVSKAGLYGAIATFSKLYFPMLSRYPSILDTISRDRRDCRDAIFEVFRLQISTCCVAHKVIDSVATLAVFTDDWNSAQADRTTKLDPFAMMEES
ncbi:uncharacterized protein BCR38DRAFT_472068 [Pseudomassariella vexata]|uniref:Uncharacterized protein n=1 Tax=Pseudomassariella vexata TaxID=1141098 RepID=A0A1Y2EAB6_9PEZI|nr:uncharacterized protein BCR38DRAFT_472068 [Pseudomassariella vexata]ORY68528.1 hypothetical protein BCR38DRAFT_472068 [Pseudomassariella vexata]